MITSSDHVKILTAMDMLLVELGNTNDKVCVVSTTAKKVLEKADVPNTELNWNYIIHILKSHYQGSTWERGSQDDGWNITIKTKIR